MKIYELCVVTKEYRYMKVEAESEQDAIDLAWDKVASANYGDFKYKHGVSRWFEPTISWAQGGPIIERERISIEDCQDGAGLYWEATRIEPPAVSEALSPTPKPKTTTQRFI
jgi:hypothetical protein